MTDRGSGLKITRCKELNISENVSFNGHHEHCFFSIASVETSRKLLFYVLLFMSVFLCLV